MTDLDDPARVAALRVTIREKPALLAFYRESYHKFAACLDRCPQEGHALELGTGAGFTKTVLPSITTSDILPYEGIDLVIDGTSLPFVDQSLSFICMINVFHHIPDVESFLKEAERCLLPGGRLFIVDQNVGPISRPVLKYLHHEAFDDRAHCWKFASSGPLSGANGALAWLVFRRDRAEFARKFPGLEVVRVSPHTPVLYWLSGGLKKWNLAPAWLMPVWVRLDNLLLRLHRNLGSFLDIEIVRR